MKIAEINNDLEHRDQLKKTGFWGKRGAGCLFQALDTGRICIAHRSDYVEQPGTWGIWGGAIDDKETPESAVRREAMEESGYGGAMELLPMYIFRSPSGFIYYNFLALVETEFRPRLDWENQGFKWTEFGKWPKPLHPGAKLLLQDAPSLKLMQQYSK